MGLRKGNLGEIADDVRPLVKGASTGQIAAFRDVATPVDVELGEIQRAAREQRVAIIFGPRADGELEFAP